MSVEIHFRKAASRDDRSCVSLYCRQHGITVFETVLMIVFVGRQVMSETNELEQRDQNNDFLFFA